MNYRHPPLNQPATNPSWPLHPQEIVHGDLSAWNVMLSSFVSDRNSSGNDPRGFVAKVRMSAKRRVWGAVGAAGVGCGGSGGCGVRWEGQVWVQWEVFASERAS